MGDWYSSSVGISFKERLDEKQRAFEKSYNQTKTKIKR